jgi:Rrf2 family iron-sulfur cluster assembly transcriptional regulator
MFSRSCHYGLQASLFIAHETADGGKVDLVTIATAQDIPRHFLSKILQTLVKQKLLKSTKGPNGGFELMRPAHKIYLYEIVEAIDGLDIFSQCGLGFKLCSNNHPCPIHDDFKVLRDQTKELFHQKTLQMLIEDVRLGNSILGLGLMEDA